MLGDVATLHSLSLSVNGPFLLFPMNSFSIPVPHVLLNITNTVCCPLRPQPGLQFVEANSLFVCGTSLLHNFHKYKVGNVEPWNCEIAMSEKQPSIFKFCDQFHLPTLNYVANFTSMAKPILHPFHSHKSPHARETPTRRR